MDKKKQAVALKYELEQREGAPRLVAVGEGFIAERIIELARQHGVPLVENKEIVGKLIRFPLDSEVPPELYEAVARILALIYTLDREEQERKNDRGITQPQV